MEDLQLLEKVVHDAKQTLMVLDVQGSLLKRIWCLFEAWHSGLKEENAQSGPKLLMLCYNIDLPTLVKVQFCLKTFLIFKVIFALVLLLWHDTLCPLSR